jgi:hypothetical protein
MAESTETRCLCYPVLYVVYDWFWENISAIENHKSDVSKFIVLSWSIFKYILITPLYYYLITEVTIKYNLKFICYPILELSDMFRSYSIIFNSFNYITVIGDFITMCCCIQVFINVFGEKTLSP